MPLQKRKQAEEFLAEFPSFLSNDYENLAKLGEGVQGKVFKVLEKSTQQIKALKCMKTLECEIISQVTFFCFFIK